MLCPCAHLCSLQPSWPVGRSPVFFHACASRLPVAVCGTNPVAKGSDKIQTQWQRGGSGLGFFAVFQARGPRSVTRLEWRPLEYQFRFIEDFYPSPKVASPGLMRWCTLCPCECRGLVSGCCFWRDTQYREPCHHASKMNVHSNKRTLFLESES